MAASRFRPPTKARPALRRQKAPPHMRRRGVEYEPEAAPVLRASLLGLRNVPRKVQDAKRRELRRKRAAERAP